MGVAGTRGGILLLVGGRSMLFECGKERALEDESMGEGFGGCFSFVLHL
jgi:hypothetical protein